MKTPSLSSRPFSRLNYFKCTIINSRSVLQTLGSTSLAEDMLTSKTALTCKHYFRCAEINLNHKTWYLTPSSNRISSELKPSKVFLLGYCRPQLFYKSKMAFKKPSNFWSLEGTNSFVFFSRNRILPYQVASSYVLSGSNPSWFSTLQR